MWTEKPLPTYPQTLLLLRRRSFFSKVKYLLPVCQVSSYSIKIALTKRKQEASFGKMRTTLVRRLISWLIRSSTFVVRMKRQWETGKESTVRPSGMFISIQSANLGADCSYFLTVLSKEHLCLFNVWRIENRTNVCGYLLFHRLTRNILTGILLQMELTSLPGNTPKNSLTSCLQSRMSITDDQLHSAQAAINQTLQEVSPMHFLFAQRD